MDDNPYEAPSTPPAPTVDSVYTQRFHRRDYLSAGCSFVVVLPLVLILLAGAVGMLASHPIESPVTSSVIFLGIVVAALLLASLSGWQALYQARRRRLRRGGPTRTRRAGKRA